MPQTRPEKHEVKCNMQQDDQITILLKIISLHWILNDDKILIIYNCNYEEYARNKHKSGGIQLD